MPKKTDREYRTMIQPLLIPTAAEKRIDTDFYVEGYATTFDKPYLLYEWDGNKYYERIDRNALAGADMSDVIMQYNHEGKVLARLSNGTLGVEANDNGLFTFADLSKSRAAQDMFEEIKNGLVTKMSWAFRTVPPRSATAFLTISRRGAGVVIHFPADRQQQGATTRTILPLRRNIVRAWLKNCVNWNFLLGDMSAEAAPHLPQRPQTARRSCTARNAQYDY